MPYTINDLAVSPTIRSKLFVSIGRCAGSVMTAPQGISRARALRQAPGSCTTRPPGRGT